MNIVSNLNRRLKLNRLYNKYLNEKIAEGKAQEGVQCATCLVSGSYKPQQQQRQVLNS